MSFLLLFLSFDIWLQIHMQILHFPGRYSNCTVQCRQLQPTRFLQQDEMANVLKLIKTTWGEKEIDATDGPNVKVVFKTLLLSVSYLLLLFAKSTVECCL